MTPEKRPAEEEEEGQQSKKLKEDEDGNAVQESNGESESSSNGDQKKIVRKFDQEKCGELLFAGCCQWDYVGRRNAKTVPGMMHYIPKIIKSMQGIEIGLVVSHCTAVHSVIITSEGLAMTLGRNEKGQLGVGDCDVRSGPVVVDTLKNQIVVDAAVGRNHSMFLTDKNELFACGDNKCGQCGVGKSDAIIHFPTKVAFDEAPIANIGCGGEFSMILDNRGYLFSFGSPEYGQLGHNTDGQYFVSSNKLSYQYETSPRRVPVFIEKGRDGHPTPVTDVQIQSFSCGQNHTVAVDKHRRGYSWGFGGYGRLGHAEQKDEYVPRLIKFFEGNKRGLNKVYCGGSYTIGMSELGTFLWGQTKRTGEANMYPKPIQDLYGWNIRAIGTSVTSIVVSADDSVIAWGPSPTYGELGFGENTKSSTTPKEVKSLDGAYITQVVCGMGHTLYVMKNETKEDKAIMAKLKIAEF